MIRISYYDFFDRKISDEEVKQNHFPDNTLLLKTEHVDFNKPIWIDWFYENDAELFTIICLAKKAKCKMLEMPYIPHARQDRCKHKEDTFTLKYFAEVINSLNFDSVWALDPHSSVSEALFDRLVVNSPEKYIKTAIGECNPDLIFYPDEGAMKRYSSMAPMEYTFGVKRRDWKTGKIEGLDVIGNVEKIKGKNILIVDDICSRGGTFYHSAKELKELGAGKIYLYVTHCENTIFDGELLTSGLIENVYTTNSIYKGTNDKITVIEI